MANAGSKAGKRVADLDSGQSKNLRKVECQESASAPSASGNTQTKQKQPLLHQKLFSPKAPINFLPFRKIEVARRKQTGLSSWDRPHCF
jgi:hypothetical protein